MVWVVVPEKDDLDLEEQIGVFGDLTEQKEYFQVGGIFQFWWN